MIRVFSEDRNETQRLDKLTCWRCEISGLWHISGNVSDSLPSVARARYIVQSVTVNKSRASRMLIRWSCDQLHGLVNVDSTPI